MRPRKPYPDYPLTAHPNGQWSKKVNRAVYYFGSWKDDADGSKALLAWVGRRDAIRAGLDKLNIKPQASGSLLGRLRDEFIEAKRLEVQAGDLSPRTLEDYQAVLNWFVQAVGATAPVTSLGPQHFAAYHQSLIKRKVGRHARKRYIAYIKAMFRWGAGDGTGRYPLPIFGNGFKAPDCSHEAIRQSKERAGIPDYSQRIVSGEDIDCLLARASTNMRGIASLNMQAVILLGINCGMGPADIARLKWPHVDLVAGTLNMVRGKTGVIRIGYLWRKTRSVLQAIKSHQGAENDGLILRSQRGNPLYEEIQHADGRVTSTKIISQYFRRLTVRVKLIWITHYRLRHSFATLGKKARDQEALNIMMGHKDATIGATYTQGWTIEPERIRNVAQIVYKQLWGEPKKQVLKPAA